VADELIRPALYDRHVELGARFAPFAGWEMPLQYAGTVAEHEAVRQRVGVFDVSHLGTVWVEGAAAHDVIARSFTNDPAPLGVGQSQYTLCPTEDGGILDDLIVYRVADARWMVVPNASSTAAVVEVLRDTASGLDAEVRDESRDWAILAVQGPESLSTLAAILDDDPAEVPYLHTREIGVPGGRAVLCRTGYTGEVGAELVVHGGAAHVVLDALLDAGAQPAGLGARDTLRLEMGYPLHGNDIGPDTTPFEARLGWAVKLDRAWFRAQDALTARKAEGVSRRLFGIRGDRRAIPRAGMQVTRGGEGAGQVRSGTFSPTLRVGIGLAYLADPIGPGDQVSIDLRGRDATFEVVLPPFVDRNPRG